MRLSFFSSGVLLTVLPQDIRSESQHLMLVISLPKPCLFFMPKSFKEMMKCDLVVFFLSVSYTRGFI